MGPIDKTWCTSEKPCAATTVIHMFNNTGRNASSFKLDLSNWNLPNVERYEYFNCYVRNKVTNPTSLGETNCVEWENMAHTGK